MGGAISTEWDEWNSKAVPASATILFSSGIRKRFPLPLQFYSRVEFESGSRFRYNSVLEWNSKAVPASVTILFSSAIRKRFPLPLQFYSQAQFESGSRFRYNSVLEWNSKAVPASATIQDEKTGETVLDSGNRGYEKSDSAFPHGEAVHKNRQWKQSIITGSPCTAGIAVLRLT